MSTPAPTPIRRRRRDRHGRGLRGNLAPAEVPLHRTRPEIFDDVVLDAVEHLASHWPGELEGIDFAVEDVPLLDPHEDLEFAPDVVCDQRVALARLVRNGTRGGDRARAADTDADTTSARPVVVLYRRPIEARASVGAERESLVFALIAELVAQLIGRDPDELHPGFGI